MPQITGWPGAGLRITPQVLVLTGAGDPNSSTTEDVIRAGGGSIFLRTDGGAGSTLYVKEGATWAAK